MYSFTGILSVVAPELHYIHYTYTNHHNSNRGHVFPRAQDIYHLDLHIKSMVIPGLCHAIG